MSKSSLFAVSCGIVVCFAGLISFLNWIFAPFEPSALSGIVPMAPNTALGFILSGLSLLLVVSEPVTPDRLWLSRLFAFCCIAFGLGTISEYVTGVDLGIDNWFARGSAEPFVGRMTFLSATNFVLVGLSFWLIDLETRAHRRVSHILSLLTLILPLQALLSLLYGIKVMVITNPLTTFMPLDPLTSVCWILLAMGTLYARGQYGIMRVVTSHSPAGIFLRRLALPGILIPILMGWFVATAEKFRLDDVSFAASLLTICCLIVFIVVLWKNGDELFRVLSQRNSALARLREANHAAQEANRAKSSFLANMSHEIRNPVGVMMGFAELLADPECAPQVRSYYAGVLKRNGRTLLAILNDILDLSKVEANKLKVESAALNLTHLIRDITLVYRGESLAKGIEFKVQWHEPVPRQIVTDPHRLRQILDNVIGNAIKFTERGYVKLEIGACSEEGNSALLTFEISDTGLGIPKHLVDRLFRPFEQADSSFTRRFGGTGLGLALSKKLATAISGDLNLKRTVPGKGSTFSLAVNVSVVQGTGQTKMIQIEREDLTKRLMGQHILVAEDSPDNRFLLENVLCSEGATVVFAENGQQAVEKASRGNFDVILMDIQMPTMDGFEASAQLRAQGFDKPIIALTAHAMKEDRLRSLASGLNDHVTKPINREELVRAVQRWAWSGNASAV